MNFIGAHLRDDGDISPRMIQVGFGFFFFFLSLFIYFEREREGGREEQRGRERAFQAGSALSVQSLMQGSISPTMRS